MLAGTAATAIAAPYTRAQAQQKFTLKFNHVLGPREPYHDGFQKWAKAVERAHQGRSHHRGLPFGAARPRGRHHRADPPGREHRPEHRLRTHGQLCARHRGDERALFRRDARRGREAAQGADRREVAGRTGEQVRPQGPVVQLGAGLSALLHQQAGQEAGGPRGPAHPHPAGSDLAGVDPRARRDAGRDGIRRDVSGPAAEARSTASSSSTTTFRAGASTRC